MRVALSIVSEIPKIRYQRLKVTMKELEANFHNNLMALTRKTRKMNLVQCCWNFAQMLFFCLQFHILNFCRNLTHKLETQLLVAKPNTIIPFILIATLIAVKAGRLGVVIITTKR